MKINHNAINQSLLPKQSATQKADRERSPASPETDHVQPDKNPAIATVTLLDKANQALRNAPVIDIERVADIRQRIGDGQYTIDNEALAGNIIEHEKALQG